MNRNLEMSEVAESYLCLGVNWTSAELRRRRSMQSYTTSLRNLREVVCCGVKSTPTVPTGPYQVLFLRAQLALRLEVCVAAAKEWQYRRKCRTQQEADRSLEFITNLRRQPTGLGGGHDMRHTSRER